MNIFFMRHGETDWNKVLKLQGTTDIPLNQEGIELAQKTSDALFKNNITFDCIFSSPLVRAKKTAQIINMYSQAPVFFDERIREFAFGQAEGLTFDEIKTNPKFSKIKNWFLKPEQYVAELGAESYESFFSRLDSFLEDLKRIEEQKENSLLPQKNFKIPQNILIVCHGGVVRGFLKQMLGWTTEKFASIKIPNCGLNLVTLHNGKFELQYTAKTFVQ